MKHQVFFFLLLYSVSMYGMDYGISRITKNQFINELTEVNCYMKEHHADTFNSKEFGLFIIGLRETDKTTFEDHKKDILALMRPMPNSIDTRETR